VFTHPRHCAALTALVLVALVPSCFFIVDKDRIRIANVNGKPVTRGDFDKVLRDMPPKKRPLIRTKGDVLTALQNYLDSLVRRKNAEDLLAQKKFFVPRELAEAVLRMREPELFVEIQNPNDYKLKEQDLAYMKQEREIRIDEMLRDLEDEQGVLFRIEQAVQQATIEISEDEYASEFEIRHGELNHPERVAFTGVLIPGTTPEARATATQVSHKLQGGSAPQDLAKEFAGANAQIIEAELPNDRSNPKFAPFWEQASGAQIGKVVGPIFIQNWTEATQDAQGKVTQRPYPNGMLTCVVTGRTEQTPKTLEESKPDLQRNILYAKVMDQLRKENGVQIFEDKLPDPGMYDAQK
jgi:hypothetical protein